MCSFNLDSNVMMTRSLWSIKNFNNQPKESLPVKLTFKFDGQTIEKNVNNINLNESNIDPLELVGIENQNVADQFDEDFNENIEFEDDENDEDFDEYNEMSEEESDSNNTKIWTKKETRERVLTKSMKKASIDDEDAWLEALEEGRLHEVDDELKRIKDPKLMTARQKALLESKTLKRKQEAIRQQELEVVAKLKARCEETVERKMIRAKQRQKAEEKKRKDTKDLIDRLLKKKSKVNNSNSFKSGTNSNSKSKQKKVEYSKITYINNQNGIYICIPQNLIDSFTLIPKSASDNLPSLIPVKCAREGCKNLKKYSSSKSGLPCCSLECYKIIENIFINQSNSNIDIFCK